MSDYVLNNLVLGVTAIILTLGLYALGAGGWAGFGLLPILGMTYVVSKEPKK